MKEDSETNSDEDYIKIEISERQFKVLKYTGLIFLFVGIYFILDSVQLFSSPVIDPSAGLALIFITGLLTSAHCVGMCSGFVLAYAMKNSQSKSQVKQHFLYNISRMGSYAFFGALAGFIGAIFMLTDQYRGYLSVFAGIFMMLYGLSTFFPWLRRITTIRTPNLIKYTKGRGPLFFGLLNGLMPCGPLQAMLIYSAGTGSAVQGGMTMLAFGLGTSPLMFGFGNVLSLITHRFVRKVVKFSAIMVMALGLVTFNRGLLLSGYGLPLPANLNLLTPTPSITGMAVAFGDFQEISMKVDKYGWNPDTFIVKKGVPVKWNIYVEELTYCFQGIRVPRYGLRYDFTRRGENVTLEFTPQEEGKVLFTCWMGMARGDIIVVEDLSEYQEPEYKKERGLTMLKIRGMCCWGCARYLERFISQIRGVKAVNVDFESRKATIRFDPEKTSSEKIIKAIKSLGRYDVQELGF